MRCPNEACGDKIHEHVNSRGGGSRYCLGGCGFYEELPAGSMAIPRRQRVEAPLPVVRSKPKRPSR